MKKRLILAATAATLLVTGIAGAAPGDRWRERMAARSGTAQAPAATTPAQVIAYGRDPAQSLNYWRAARTGNRAPLVVFIHGGGWSRGSKDNASGQWKATHYPQAGYNFASIDYRMVPAFTVEQQAADVASALKALLDRADALGIDRRHVVLMGHSAGAHLAALVGTDERYLRGAGLSFADLSGVIPLDGAGYDVAAQLTGAGPRLKRTYVQAFGTDPARQRALSPMSHAGAPNAANFLFVHVDRDDSAQQSTELANALRRAGTRTQVEKVEGREMRGHMEINRRLGDPSYPATGIVDRWLAQLFAS